EAHGCLCGAVCVADDYPLERWLEEMFDDSSLSSDAGDIGAVKDVLRVLHADTVRALHGDEMEFAPFLPDDDLPLDKRAEYLAQWCQGFLYGYGSIGNERRPNLSRDASEVLRDFSQVARASAGASDPTEEDESDYAEIIEYVRVSVQLLFDELAEHRGSRRPTGHPLPGHRLQ
ncbi:MAG TPA: UPF0149 family protein, partial [Steroidobacteraceae bacterium]|nr:UPF0149 family protein [Steroidobacteraceae bacterium]